MITRCLAVTLFCLGFSQVSGAQQFRIAHNRSLPPLAEVQEGKSVGLAIDIVRAAAMRVNIDVVFVPVTIEQQVPSLKEGHADALLSANTSERQQFLDFSDPVLMTGAALYVRAPNPAPESLSSLAGKTVVTPRAGPLAEFIRKTAPAVNLVVTQDYEESLARIVAGEADAAALNFSAGNRIAARLYPNQISLPRIMFDQQPFAVGVLKGQSGKVLAELNAGLAAVRADGTWQGLNNRWMGN
jgi:ABC-type amino acid transport substrate-binding protein